MEKIVSFTLSFIHFISSVPSLSPILIFHPFYLLILLSIISLSIPSSSSRLNRFLTPVLPFLYFFSTFISFCPFFHIDFPSISFVCPILIPLLIPLCKTVPSPPQRTLNLLWNDGMNYDLCSAQSYIQMLLCQVMIFGVMLLSMKNLKHVSYSVPSNFIKLNMAKAL